MIESKLKHIAASFLNVNYNVKLNIPIKRNNRLRSTYGRFILKNNEPNCIELAGVLLDYGVEEVIFNILKHECIHYALFEKQQPYRDGHPVFESELKRHGVLGTGKVLIGKFHVLKCKNCGKTSLTSKKRTIAHPEDYRTVCCQSTFDIVDEQIYDGTNQP